MALRTFAAAALLFTISLKPAFPQEVNGAGLGMLSCSAMMVRVIQNVYYADAVAEWVTGFVTGANGLYISANKKYKDPTTLLAGGNGHVAKMVIAGCQADPTQPVVAVVERLYWALPSKDWR